MQIVINISEKMYEQLKFLDELGFGTVIDEAVANGIPLPKGHGRLIDADALEKKMCDREEELKDDQAVWESSAVSVALDMFAPTIIEADKLPNNELENPFNDSRFGG